MSYPLTFTIVNSQTVDIEIPVEVDGHPATAKMPRTVVEAAPTDRAGKTLTLVLPSAALDEFPEGGTITLSIDPAVAPTVSEA